MQQRHPELAQKMRSAGLEKRILKEQMPHHVGAPSVTPSAAPFWVHRCL